MTGGWRPAGVMTTNAGRVPRVVDCRACQQRVGEHEHRSNDVGELSRLFRRRR